MNLEDKRIGNTEIKNFFRAIAYYINDPKTFYNFSLVNKLSNLACKEFTAMKIYEFCEEYTLRYNEENFYIFKVLPSGELQGLGRYINGYQYECIYYHERGLNKFISTDYYTSPFKSIFLKKRNVLIEYDESYVAIRNINNMCLSKTVKCTLCNKFHVFKFFFSLGNRTVQYSKDCYSKEKYKFYKDFGYEFRGFRSRNLIKSVIQYSRTLL